MTTQFRAFVSTWWEVVKRWWRRPPAKVRLLLVLDGQREPMRGRDLAAKASVGQGMVYVWLGQLEEDGFVWSFAAEGDPRRWYRITHLGKQRLMARRRELGVSA